MLLMSMTLGTVLSVSKKNRKFLQKKKTSALFKTL
jgi:hypothetical protein